jgi:hypothetical protein
VCTLYVGCVIGKFDADRQYSVVSWNAPPHLSRRATENRRTATKFHVRSNVSSMAIGFHCNVKKKKRKKNVI